MPNHCTYMRKPLWITFDSSVTLGYFVLIKPHLRWMAKPTFEFYILFLLSPLEEGGDGRVFPPWVMKRLCKVCWGRRTENPVLGWLLVQHCGHVYVVGLSTVWFLSDVILFKCKGPLILSYIEMSIFRDPTLPVISIVLKWST